MIERVIKIRKLRLSTKRKKYITYFIFLKIIAIHYLIFAAFTYFISPTSAYYTDNETATSTIKAISASWDKSSLKFIDQGGTCSPGIFAEIQNKSDSKDMKGTSTYQVYFTNINNQNAKDGKVVATGTVSPLKSGETQILKYTPNENGKYMFRALQRPGHPGAGELWSEEISINCIKNQNIVPESQKETSKEQSNKSETKTSKEQYDESNTETSNEPSTNEPNNPTSEPSSNEPNNPTSTEPSSNESNIPIPTEQSPEAASNTETTNTATISNP